MKWRDRFWILWLCATSFACLAAPARADGGAALLVRVEGFRDATGQAVIALYDAPDAWLKRDKARLVRTLPIQSGAVELRFDALPPGTYAVSVVHDTNRNGKLDMRWLPWPKPKEGIGCSNDPRGGRPKWDEAKLAVRADTRVVIHMLYP